MPFNAQQQTQRIISWIRSYFSNTPLGAVIGISGGKDSAIVASLCVSALGKEKVLGVLLPNGKPNDFTDALALINHLEIQHKIVNIKNSVDTFIEGILTSGQTLSKAAKLNIPDSLRMAHLYAIAASTNSLVANTSNLSENFLGYTTKFGTSKGDFSPLSDYTATEVKQIGHELLLPEDLINKTPTDGLSDESDEEKFGFSYEVLDKYIRTKTCENPEIKAKIDAMHKSTRHKFNMPKCEYNQI